MKILVIPDIHGAWKQALNYIKVNKDLVDKIVTLGDYVDDFDESINGQPMIDGFTELCSLARAEPNKFCICIGNHDLSYISTSRDGACVSGHHNNYAKDYRKMFEDNIDLLNIAYNLDGVIFSHAGISMFFYNKLVSLYEQEFYITMATEEQKKKLSELQDNQATAEGIQNFNDYYMEVLKDCRSRYKQFPCKFSVNTINKIFHTTTKVYNFDRIEEVPHRAEFFDHCGWSSTGDSSGESCLWIRPPALIDDNWPEKIKAQVVGHTEMGLSFLTRKKHKLIVCDNHQHDCFFLLDTNSIKDFTWKKIEVKARKLSDGERRLLELLGMT